MTVIRPIFSYADLAQLPDDGKRYEILEAQIAVTPAPTPRHQRATLNLAVLLRRAEAAGYGTVYVSPLDVVFDPHNVAEPDVLFIARDRLDIITDKNIQGVPNLLIEVLSPSTRDRDLGTKLRVYAAFGVPFYWVVDPGAQTVQVYTLGAEGYVKEPLLRAGDRLTSPLFPTITIEVAELFA